MQSTIDKIKEIVTEAMNKEDIIVCSVSYEKENNYNFLKIVLDKVNGIDLDTIVEATNIINPLLDEYDLISEEYVLDIDLDIFSKDMDYIPYDFRIDKIKKLIENAKVITIATSPYFIEQDYAIKVLKELFNCDIIE